MKRKKNFKGKKSSKHSKLNLFQKTDIKFARACPLSGKDAPVIDYKNIKLLKTQLGNVAKLNVMQFSKFC